MTREIKGRTPVVCQNGHKAFWYWKIDSGVCGTDIAHVAHYGVPDDVKCNCSKQELGQGYAPAGDNELFTGLKDRNSKEIYEGDLFYEKGCEKPIEVYYDARVAQFRGRVGGDMQYDKTRPLTWHNSWEVIGNIWEYNHLLEVEYD